MDSNQDENEQQSTAIIQDIQDENEELTSTVFIEDNNTVNQDVTLRDNRNEDFFDKTTSFRFCTYKNLFILLSVSVIALISFYRMVPLTDPSVQKVFQPTELANVTNITNHNNPTDNNTDKEYTPCDENCANDPYKEMKGCISGKGHTYDHNRQFPHKAQFCYVQKYNFNQRYCPISRPTYDNKAPFFIYVYIPTFNAVDRVNMKLCWLLHILLRQLKRPIYMFYDDCNGQIDDSLCILHPNSMAVFNIHGHKNYPAHIDEQCNRLGKKCPILFLQNGEGGYMWKLNTTNFPLILRNYDMKRNVVKESYGDFGSHYKDNTNIHYVPLGYRAILTSHPSSKQAINQLINLDYPYTPISKRKKFCYFFGHIHKLREKYLLPMEDVNCKVQFGAEGEHHINLQDTIFVPCIEGYDNETFRHYETIHNGAIPILLKHNFANLAFGICSNCSSSNLREAQNKLEELGVPFVDSILDIRSAISPFILDNYDKNDKTSYVINYLNFTKLEIVQSNMMKFYRNEFIPGWGNYIQHLIENVIKGWID